ncbi:MAG: hypothetical protein HYT61_00130 [Candidatus Yanofskybacteria bacterium]|nr:hypothetical protein [Candidatus Yanofskybacteria bacterium]
MPADNQYYYDLATDRASYQKLREEDLARQQAEEEQNQERMGWGTFLVALVLSLIADAVELITIGTLGWFVGFVVDLILMTMLGFSRAGRKQWKKWIWGPIIEKVPILAAIPFFRATFLTWAFISSRSPILQQLSKAASPK